MGRTFEDHVDFYGRGFETEIVRKEEGLCDYMFSIAIENASYETYFEKLLDCFATGTFCLLWCSHIEIIKKMVSSITAKNLTYQMNFTTVKWMLSKKTWKKPRKWKS